MAEHDPDIIVKSEAFKAINMLVDAKAEELRAVLNAFKSRVATVVAPPQHGSSPYVDTRVSYEEPRRGERQHLDLPFDPVLMDQLRWYIDETARLQREINELQRFKLRLLNDYDFTHGNNVEQIELFGTPPADEDVERIAMHLYCFGSYDKNRPVTPENEENWFVCMAAVKDNYRATARRKLATGEA